MNPLRVSGSGYARFADFDIEIPAGTVAVVGPNGAGKSTLLNAIELALFADGSKDLARCLGPFADRLELQLLFEHGGEMYRVQRTFKPGKATLDFEQLGELRIGCVAPEAFAKSWIPLSLETTKATQQLICDTLGLSRATFNASSFLGQGNAAAFPLADPADRKKLLGEIFDPRGVYPALAKAASDRAKRCEIELAAANHEAGALELAVVDIPDRLHDLRRLEVAEQHLRAAVLGEESALERAQAAVIENALYAESVRRLTAELDHAKKEQARLAEEHLLAKFAAGALSETRDRLAVVTETAGRLPALEAAVRDQQNARDRRAQAEAKRALLLVDVERHRDAIERLRVDRDRLIKKNSLLMVRRSALIDADADRERSDRCKQMLGAQARNDAIENITAEARSLLCEIRSKTAAVMSHTEQAEKATRHADAIEVHSANGAVEDQEIQEAREAVAERAALVERVAALEQSAGRLPELDAALTEATAKTVSLARDLAAETEQAHDEARLLTAVETARETLTERRAALEATVADVTRARQTVERLQHDAAVLEVVRASADALHAGLDLLRRAERMFGRDGIPTMIAENVIPAIETEANRILDRLPTVDGVTFRVELRTQREKQDGALKEELHIVVCDLDGARPYETYSGGEKARVNIALRLALARLLAHRSGAEIRMLAVDELEYLDELGQEKLAEVLSEAAADYSRVLVVSHAPGIRDAFESSIEVVKSGGVSRVLAPAAAVAAVAA